PEAPVRRLRRRASVVRWPRQPGRSSWSSWRRLLLRVRFTWFFFAGRRAVGGWLRRVGQLGRWQGGLEQRRLVRGGATGWSAGLRGALVAVLVARLPGPATL